MTDDQDALMCRRSPAEIDRGLAGAGSFAPSALRAFDLHVHYLPPAYRDLVLAAGITKPDGFSGGVPAWSAEDHLAHMERLGIETSVVSISTPGVVLGGDASPSTVARAANEGGAALVADHPGRFGFYAALPVPDADAALAELEHAVDELGAWGVCLLTNVDGCYLGDPVLEPVMVEISRRELPLLVHPTQPPVLVPEVMAGWSRSMYEYFFDTTRALTNLVFSGQLERHPGVKLVVPHAGAALPALAQRIERNVWRANASTADGAPGYPSFVETLRRCWFDLAGSVLPFQLPSLLALADSDRIVYGSDYPFTNDVMGADLALDLRTSDALDDGLRTRILRDNAVGLFPQLAAARVGA
ncbi:MAG: amidohydrolase [Nocardioidaceae bacterium]|nr:amidohydrolase [Nocardioidaceae bacterium]